MSLALMKLTIILFIESKGWDISKAIPGDVVEATIWVRHSSLLQGIKWDSHQVCDGV